LWKLWKTRGIFGGKRQNPHPAKEKTAPSRVDEKSAERIYNQYVDVIEDENGTPVKLQRKLPPS
jgi:hypothetical protein